eukprot:scaffold120424_cov57-Phaeocystis_antarctica.AAC.3
MLWGDNGPPPGISIHSFITAAASAASLSIANHNVRHHDTNLSLLPLLRHVAAAARARPSHAYAPHRTCAHPSRPPRLRRLTQTNHG